MPVTIDGDSLEIDCTLQRLLLGQRFIDVPFENRSATSAKAKAGHPR